VDYQEARSQILDGDIIQVRTTHGLFGWLTKLFTGVYTHTAIAVWLDGGLWMVEINGGRNHAIPMSQLDNVDFDVFYPPYSLTRSLIREAILESIRVKTNYGYFATIATGINEFFGFNRFIHWRNQLDCTGYVVKILQKSGWSEHSYIVSPTKLSEELILRLEVRK
jgi:hypothetical protein